MSTYDLTGADPEFLRSDVRFAVFEANQRLYLNEPAFANSIEIVWLDGATNPTLIEGVQWRTTYTDRDYAAMSEAKLIDSNFSDILVKSIENLDVPASDRIYAVQYQALKLKPSEEDPGIYGPNPTPGLLTELIQDVDFLKLVKNPLSDLTSDATDGIKALQEDVTGVDSANLIEDERHFVDVPNNKMIIRPSAGAFFEHDVVLTNVTTGLPLVEGTDYKFIGWNRSKQAIAEHTSHVYDYIMLLIPLVGNVDVTYHAFGGEATISDINAIKDVLADITMTLTEGNYLSAEALPLTDTIVNIISRVAAIEDVTRHYVHATHQYAAETDGLHWFTIASLYRDTWDTETLSEGQVNLTLRSWTHDWTYDVVLSVDVSDKVDSLKVRTLASSDVNNTFNIGRYDNLEDRNVPMIRAIWHDDGTYGSGVLIQIGQMMTALQPEVLSVYDRSGSSSEFVIRPNIVGQDVVYDDDVELPDGTIWEEPYRGRFDDQPALIAAEPTGKPGWYAYVDGTGFMQWNEGTTNWEVKTFPAGAPSYILVPPGYGINGLEDAHSRVDYQSIFPDEGFLAFAGNIPMHKIQIPQTVGNVGALPTIIHPPFGDLTGLYIFNTSKVKRVTIVVYDRFNDIYLEKSTEVNWQQEYISAFETGAGDNPGPAWPTGRCNILFHEEDLCALQMTFGKIPSPANPNGNYATMTVVSNIGTESILNERFELREVLFHGKRG